MILPCTPPVVVSEEICKSDPFQGPLGDTLVAEVEVLEVLALAVVDNNTVIIQVNGDKTNMDTYIQTKVLLEAVTLLPNYKVANHPHLLAVEDDHLLQARNLNPYNHAINFQTQLPQINLHVSVPQNL